MSAVLKGGDMSRHGVTVKMERDMPAGAREDQQVHKEVHSSSGHQSLESLVNNLCNDTDNGSCERGNRKNKELTNAEVLKHLQIVATACAELNGIGVEAGLMLFEGNSKVWCCGSIRLKHLATHPQMTNVLSEITSTEAEEQMTLEKWTVVDLLTSSCSTLTLQHRRHHHHHRHHSPYSISQSHGFPTSTSSHTNCSSGEDRRGVSYPSLSSFQTLTETDSSFSSVTDMGDERSGKKSTENEPLTLTCDHGETGPLTLTKSIKGEPMTSACDSEPLTSTCASEDEQTLRFSGKGKPATLARASEDDPLTLTSAGEDEGQESMSQEEEEEDVSGDDVSVRFEEQSALDSEDGRRNLDGKVCNTKEWQMKMVCSILGKSSPPRKQRQTSRGSRVPLLGAGADSMSTKQWQEMMVRYILEGSPQGPQPSTHPTSHTTPLHAKSAGTTTASSADATHTSVISPPADVSTTPTTITTPSTTSTTLTLTSDATSSPTTSTSTPIMESVNVDVPFSSRSDSLTDSQPWQACPSQVSSQWQQMMISYITDGCSQSMDTLPSTLNPTPQPASSVGNPSMMDLTSAVADIISSDPQLSSLPDRAGKASGGPVLLSSQWQQMMVSYITDGCPQAQAPKIMKPEKRQQRVRRTPWCEVCETSFAGRAELKRHRLEMHPKGSRPFLCTLCPKRFAQKHQLELHLRRHMGVKPYQCEQCGFRCCDKANLQVHMMIHSNEKPFSCDICGKRFRAMCALKVHQRWHAGEAPYLCDICGKGFRQGGRLTEHRRIHTGETPFPCSYCEKAFITNRLLKIHERIHTGIEPHTCHFCGKAFKRGKHLTIHLRLHTGERPYSCDVCGTSFHRSDLLTAHLRKHNLGTDKKLQPSGPHKK